MNNKAFMIPFSEKIDEEIEQFSSKLNNNDLWAVALSGIAVVALTGTICYSLGSQNPDLSSAGKKLNSARWTNNS